MPAAVATAFVLALWIWALWTRRAEWVLAGTIYLAGLAVTANLLVPTGTIMGERLAYLPSAGFCLLVVLIWSRLEDHKRRLAWAVFAIFVAALALRTVVRNRDWRDNFTLFSAAIRAVPGSAKMHAELGGEYVKRRQLDAARMEFQTALRIDPGFPEALESYGLAESRTGHDQEARRLLETALSLTGKDNIDYDFRAVNLAAQLMKLGQNDERPEAFGPGNRDVPRLRSRVVEPRGNSLWARRGGVSPCRRADCHTFGSRQLAGSKPTDLAERTRLLRASALACRSAGRGWQDLSESYCVVRLGRIVEEFSWPLAKRCAPSEGEAGGDNYPDAEEAEEGIGAEAEAAEDEDEADNGTSVSVVAEAGAAR